MGTEALFLHPLQTTVPLEAGVWPKVLWTGQLEWGSVPPWKRQTTHFEDNPSKATRARMEGFLANII